ncbi:phenylacetate--CoA ligase family protein [Sedimenticola selenatireducens]|uniref:Phenylacetate--CoA ligase n=1 Tax=Sedimenticola selenatireducens TaxID=191960 RepID=A0A557SMR0_9GAMM|nr:AMP-binding protein [Sedimenticola selenatireducens]TVO78715.1 phenylacetate--CoA ligase [Sedimenticola selenatireducens]TVT62077.1 MAG: phenylacetate--CoA ligase [Sedimenticola selenatireducens]
MTHYYDELETQDTQTRQEALIKAVAAQVAHAKNNTVAYGKIFADIKPDELTSVGAIAQLPLTRKSALIELQAAAKPFGGLAAVRPPELTHIFASPGPIYEPGSKRKDFWRFSRALYATGFRKGELVHNCFSYHFVPAGLMLESGAHALECAVIPAGVGQTELQVQTIADLRPDGYVGTPSFLKIILEKADDMGADVSSMKKALVSGEALPPPLREGFKKRGIQVLQCYATADLGVIAYETEAMEGLVIDEGVYVEIVRPGTGEPVADGEVGEVVVTSLNPDYPLIRFATGDLSAIMAGTSPCGRTNRRIKGWMGRADQTAKVRGMFIHPEQVDKVIKRHPEINKARLMVDWIDESDSITLQYETTSHSDALDSAIANSIRDICKVRGNAQVMGLGSLPNDGKVIDDIRKYD